MIETDTIKIVKYILKKNGGRIRGRKRLQKLIYFIDSLHSLPDIKFYMDLYGPYSRELNDLIMLEGDPYGISSRLREYDDSVVVEISLIDREEVHLEGKLKCVVDRVLHDFGGLDIIRLEQYSSVHYITTTTGEKDPEKIKKILDLLKPSNFYTVRDIQKAIEFLEMKGYLY